MRSLLGRFHRPFARSADEQLLLMNNLGDGSTLSLDFTSGVLDPRLTFTRGSNATFINSSGLVQYANHNLFFNTRFDGISGTSPTLTNVGWSYTFSAIDSSATFNGDGTVTISATNSRRSLQRVTGFSGSSRRMIVSVDILTSGDTGLVPTQLLRDGSLLNSAYFINGSPYVSGNVFGPCTLSYVCDAPTPGTFTPYFGVGTSGNSTGTVTFANPRMGLFGGVAPLPYYANTSSGASPSERHDPRFDYDPTTIGSPRGLLIEGSAVNLLLNSGDFTGYNFVQTILGATATAPDNGTAYTLLENNAATTQFVMTSGGRTVSASTAYTLSVFVKAAATPRRYLVLRVNDNASNANAASLVWDTQTNTVSGAATAYGTFSAASSNVTQYGSSWYRVELRFTNGAGITSVNCKWELSNDGSRTADGQSNSYLGGTTAGILLWGAQLETGSGASSYIPTGASTGSRSADNCVTAIANLTGFNANQGTIYEAWRDNTASDTSVVQEWAFAFGTTGANGCGVFVSNAASGTFGINGGVSNTGDAGPAGTYVIGGLNKAAVAIDVAGTSMKLSANGSAIATGTNTGGYSTAQTFSLGQRNNNARYLNGWIRQFKYWPYLLPDAQLTSLTT